MGLVLTRLHLRYGKDGLGEDLVFRTAPPITGGREFLSDGKRLEIGAVQSSYNNFQARYAIRHAWTGPIACKEPVRGVWGGPPSGVTNKGTQAAQKLAFAKRDGLDLVAMIARDNNETKIDIGLLMTAAAMNAATPAPEPSANAAPPPTDTAIAPPTPSATTPSAMTPSTASAPQPPPAPPEGGCAGCRVGESESRAARTRGAVGIVAAMGIAIARMLRRKKAR
jgi:hypothetical protein